MRPTLVSPGASPACPLHDGSVNGIIFWSSGPTFTVTPRATSIPTSPSGTSVSGAAHYDVWGNTVIDGQESIGSPVRRNTNATGPFWTPNPAQSLSRDQAHRWYIGAVSNDGTTFWSLGIDFFVRPWPLRSVRWSVSVRRRGDAPSQGEP